FFEPPLNGGRRMTSIRIIAVALLVALGVQAPCRAELPHIRLDRIFPLGGQAGSDVDLEIGGKDLDDVKSLHFDHAGLKAVLTQQLPRDDRLRCANWYPRGAGGRQVRYQRRATIRGEPRLD